GGAFTVRGAGADIWGSADAFQFVHEAMTGDGSIVARVAAIDNVQAWTKAGVMIRDGTAGGGPNAGMTVPAGKGASIRERKAAGGGPAALPAGWQTTDVGAVGKSGSASEAGGTFTIAGAGADIWGTADAFRYGYRLLAADGSIVARVASVQNVNTWTKAGVMI